MGIEHHHLPVFISAAFADARVLSAFPALPHEAISHYERALLRGGNNRERPVMVLEKGPNGGSLCCRPARKVCVARHLYSIPTFSDSRAPGLALHILRESLGIDIPRPRDDGELLDWAESLTQLRVARTALEDRVAHLLDGPAASAAARVRASGVLALPDAKPLARLVEFAWVRTPHWMASNQATLRQQAKDAMDAFPPFRAQSRYFTSAVEFLTVYRQVTLGIAHLMLLGTFVSPGRAYLFDQPMFRLILFDARGCETPFVQADNAARPLNIRLPHLAHRAGAPGLKDPSTFVLYPISPQLMLGVTTDQSRPSLSTSSVCDAFVRRVNTGFLNMAVSEVVLPVADVPLFIDGIVPTAIPPFLEHAPMSPRASGTP